MTLLRTVIVAPVSEKVTFRGAVRSTLARLSEPSAAASNRAGEACAEEADGLPSELLSDGPLVRAARATWTGL